MTITARKLRTAADNDRFRMALVAPDQAFFASEEKYGVGRLERLVSPATLAAYQRGWSAYRVALEEGDAEAVEQIGPKMIAALQFMDAEATAAGHQPLAPDTWEIGLPDGRVMCVVRSQAEAAAVLRAEKAPKAVSAAPRLGMTMVSEAPTPEPPSTESTIPPDLAVTVRQQHEGRALTVITMAEVAALLLMAEGKITGTKWDGDATYSGRQRGEQAAADIVRQGYPLDTPLAADVKPAALAF